MKSLSTVKRGKIAAPARIVLYGPEGVGKSTFGSDAPRPLFMGAERGTEHLDVERISHEELRSWGDVIQWLEVLTRDAHDYQTLVVDTLDWLEALVHEFVAQRNGVQSVADMKFAEGYKKALPEWREFLRRLDALRDRRGMHVVLLAHAKVTKHDDPAGESWDRWSLKLHDGRSASASDLVKEWANEVLFATFDERARQKNKWDRKGVGSGRRVIHTQRGAAFDAKNRHDLPATLELSWGAVWQRILVSSGKVSGAELVRALDGLRELAEALPDEEAGKLRGWIEGSARSGAVDRATMGKVGNRARVILERAQEQREEAPVPSPGPSPAPAPGRAPSPGPSPAPAPGRAPSPGPSPAPPPSAPEFGYPSDEG